MKQLPFLLLAILLILPAKVFADGCFVAPKFVWDKHRDINEPSQKAILVYDAGREDLILQVKYEGPVDDFGWIIPVPNLPTVQKGSMKCFYELSQYTQRHFESEWPHSQSKSARMSPGTLGVDSGGTPEPPVKVVETKTVGAYEIAVLATKDSSALASWLETNRFYFPTNKTEVLDYYVKQQWYFIAVKISLGQTRAKSSAIASALTGGELNPLQISFASERCVFPLKISSVNGKPSEVQVFVLSPEPLLERAMLEKKLPLIYSNDLAQAARNAKSFESSQMMQRDMHRRFMGVTSVSDSPPSAETMQGIQRIRETPAEPGPDELLPYAKVTKTDLPDCNALIPQLAEKSWWLTKQTWTFRPEEMRDLTFEPAFGVFSEKLGTKYGYFAAESLAHFQGDAVPAFLAAFQNTNPVVRANAASIFNRGYGEIFDSRLADAAVAWLKDSEPEIRMTAVTILTEYSNWKPKYAVPIIAMLRDKDSGVRHAVVFALPRFRGDLEKHIPAIQRMLKDPDANARAASLEIINRLGIEAEMSRADLLSLFASSDFRVLDAAYTQLGGRQGEISGDEALVMLQSQQIVARLLGLHALNQKLEKKSVELALPLLRDTDEMVRLTAAQTLRSLTGQKFSEDQPDEWTKWWLKNKTNFVVQPHPEELRPERFRRSVFGGDDDTPPPSVPK